jgi:two-component SAPR family response regulator
MLRLDPGVIFSDAQEFLELARTARVTPGAAAIEPLERARALYQGDLLDGPQVRRYMWVDERDKSGVTLREHFRRLFQQASGRLAELYVGTHHVAQAIAVYRELTEIDAGDEESWRALFRLHADLGDRLALVAEERRMRAALRELADEVDEADSAAADEPSEETVREFQRLLASLRDGERAPAAVGR